MLATPINFTLCDLLARHARGRYQNEPGESTWHHEFTNTEGYERQTNLVVLPVTSPRFVNRMQNRRDLLVLTPRCLFLTSLFLKAFTYGHRFSSGRSTNLVVAFVLSIIHRSIVLLLTKHMPDRFAQPPHHGHPRDLASASSFDLAVPSSEPGIPA